MSRALALVVAAAALAFAAAVPASAKTTWLCSPQQSNDPCDYALTSTVIQPDGARSTQTAKAARNPKVDCFYVYPTVSDQQTPNATLAKDPEIKAIATYQARASAGLPRVGADVQAGDARRDPRGHGEPGRGRDAYKSARGAFATTSSTTTTGAGSC